MLDGTTSDVGSTSASDCICAVGSYLDSSLGNCRSCVGGFTTSGTDSVSASDCNICLVGYYLDASLGACVVEVAPNNVIAAYEAALDGIVIRVTPGEVDLSSGQLQITKAVTFECTDPTTKCIFDAKASSSSRRRVIYDTHGKTATSKYIGLDITGGYTVRLKRNNRKRRSQHRSVVGSRSKKTTN